MKQAFFRKKRPVRALSGQASGPPRMLAARQATFHAAIVTGWPVLPVICFARHEPGRPVSVRSFNTL